jgi:hypothetical protein
MLAYLNIIQSAVPWAICLYLAISAVLLCRTLASGPWSGPTVPGPPSSLCWHSAAHNLQACQAQLILVLLCSPGGQVPLGSLSIFEFEFEAVWIFVQLL